ncbi:MAG: hypothetical protein HWD63_14630 [Candidatus Parvibacillus calidus]|nr:MAG: hypothetical protein HWD63_14630 [Candidatus Parvibacillus calidus]
MLLKTQDGLNGFGTERGLRIKRFAGRGRRGLGCRHEVGRRIITAPVITASNPGDSF